MDPDAIALEEAIARGKVEAARTSAPSEKFLAGARLFDIVRNRMLAGIRSLHPEWGEAEVEAEFSERLKTVRRLEDRGIFTPVGQE
jgi:hypothetical protein